jgi:hypothetical protein
LRSGPNDARDSPPGQSVDFTVPPNSIVPNYNRISVGQREALDAGAYVARTDDALANWYNPAGLVLSEKTALKASSNVYELTKTTLTGAGPASDVTSIVAALRPSHRPPLSQMTVSSPSTSSHCDNSYDRDRNPLGPVPSMPA